MEGMAVAMRTLKDWEDRPIASITQADIQAWHDGHLARGKEGAANSYLIHLRAVFRWAKQRGIIAVNPAAAVTAGGAHGSRDRVLSYDELVAIWRATGSDHPFHAIVRLLLLTGQRREEVGGMDWSEIDLEAGLWALPAIRAKNRRQHVVPLSAPALAILAARPSRSGLIFPNRYHKPYSGWSAALDKLRDELGLPYWRLHDLRRSLVTHMSEDLRVAPHIIESIVNHITGFRAGVAGVYNKALYMDERRQALAAWADHLLGKVGEGER
jgi:integrase